MKNSTPLKIFTIFLFFLLIVVFVIYRTGGFSDNDLMSAKVAGIDGVFEGSKTDTVPAFFRDSVLSEYRKLHMMSGSKSAPVLPADNHPSMKALVDSLWRRRRAQPGFKGFTGKDTTTTKMILHGTKSGVILPKTKQ